MSSLEILEPISCLGVSPLGAPEMCQLPNNLNFPVLLRNSPVSNWKAMTRWNSEEYLIQHLPTLFRVRAGPTSTFTYWQANKPFSKRYPQPFQLLNMTSSRFFDELNSKASSERTRTLYYSHQIFHPLGAPLLIEDLRAEKDEETFLDIDSFEKGRVNLWIGGKGTIAQAHYDPEDNWFIQISGTKRFFLSPPNDWEELCPFPLPHPSDRQSQANFSFNSFNACENSGSASIWEATLLPGDLLYLPAYWWHRVEALSNSVSVNAWNAKPHNFVSRLSRIRMPQKSLSVKELQSVFKHLIQKLENEIMDNHFSVLKTNFAERIFNSRWKQLSADFEDCREENVVCLENIAHNSIDQSWIRWLDAIVSEAKNSFVVEDNSLEHQRGIVELVLSNYLEFTIGKIMGNDEICSIIKQLYKCKLMNEN
jgi:hypothetical protein